MRKPGNRTLPAIAFDLDGVLVESRELHFKAFQKALLEEGIFLDRIEHQRDLDGLPTREKLNRLVQLKRIDAKLVDGVFARKQFYTHEWLSDYLTFPNELQANIRELHERGFTIAVATNARRKTMVDMLEQTGIRKYVQHLLSAEDGYKPKPSPDIYLEIMRLTNRTASDLFIFEDSAHGIQAAHASGAHVIQVRNPEETVARIREFVSLSSDDDAFGLDRLTS